ncbi:MAG: iron-sulfur cluster carrier protein ApbC [Gammaproteobacteria bacterium]
MTDTDIETIRKAIGGTDLPGLDIDLAAAKAAIDVEITGGTAAIRVTLGFPAAGIVDELARQIADRVVANTAADAADVEIDWRVRAHAVQGTLEPLENVRNVIAVGSGKGGVGKSTTAVNLALALAAEGARVGVLDADVYGPSQPRMLGVCGERVGSADGTTMEPIEAHGVQTVSMGLLVDEEKPMIWRGPMVTQAVNQLIFQTNWQDLDYLIVDLPPGTGDTQLTLTQKVPLAGAIIITTPQDIALLDARKGLKMFETVNVPVLGVIENMSLHVCSHCGHEEPIFGSGGGDRLAVESDVPLLGRLPLDIDIRRDADGGDPTVVAKPGSAAARAYREAARRAAALLSLRGVDHKSVFPRVVVENA